jgi:hypothetical protein
MQKFRVWNIYRVCCKKPWVALKQGNGSIALEVKRITCASINELK